MPTFVYARIRVLSLVISLVLTGATQRIFAASIPVTQIVLYKHGVAYFEREGRIPNGEEARLDFKSTEMNDVLKSLTVAAVSGSAVSGIRYDSNETLDQQLSRYPFKIGDQQLLSAFLDTLKGARIELKVAERAVTGVILGGAQLKWAARTTGA